MFFNSPAALALRKISFGAIFSGKKSAGQREVTNHAQPIRHANTLQVFLVVSAIVEIVIRLQRLVSRQSMFLANRERLREARPAIVRSADRSYLAVLNQLSKCAQRFFQGCIRIVFMRLV